MTHTADRASSLRAYPNIRAAAAMLEVSPATLSRRKDVERLRRGERDVVIAPREVLRLATVYRKRSLNDVAFDVLEHARRVSQEESGGVEAEIERFFEERSPSEEERERFRALARQLLPPELATQVETVLSEPAERVPGLVQGYRQPPQS